MNIEQNTILDIVEKHTNGDYTYSSNYGEPGYTDPEQLILFANWNDTPKYLTNWLENHGYDLEWSDEWTQDESGKAYRTQPDSYSWTPSYYVIDGEVIGKEIASHDNYESYVSEYLSNDPHKADLFDVDLELLGYSKFNDERYESGFHLGQDDDSNVIFDKLKDYFESVVFKLTNKGQFDVYFDVYVKSEI